ncbi:uncharacterized protein VTP21DRAFT_631 [Calcarisporiella thermophila]|uniref:uncharacterized protein n=1 Tax=Calcarisporiella thermophila TaxID=911321 RepID=UPI0037434435
MLLEPGHDLHHRLLFGLRQVLHPECSPECAKTLESVAKALATSRPQEGWEVRDTEVWIAFSDAYGNLSKLFEEDSGLKMNDIEEVMLGILKVTRNLAAGVPKNQREIFERGSFEIIVGWVKKLNAETLETSNDKRKLLLRIALQTLSNTVTANEELIKRAWNLWICDDVIGGLLRREDNDLFEVSMICLNNNLAGSKEQSMLFVSSDFGRQTLELCLLKSEHLLHDESQNFERVHDTVSILVRHNLASKIWSLLRSPNNQTPLSPAQIPFLKFYAEHTQIPSELETEWFCREFLKISDHFSVLLDQITNSKSNLKEADGDGRSSDNTSGSTLDVESMSQLHAGLVLMLQVLARTAEQVGDIMLREGIVDRCVTLLGQCEKSLPRASKPANVTLTHEEEESAAKGFMYIRRDLVRVIGNMAHGRRAVQDKVRELGGVPLILNQANIDDYNPYIREYTILAIRNLMADNAENQQFLKDLRPIGAAQHPVLQEVGYRTELAPDGTVRVVRAKRD